MLFRSSDVLYAQVVENQIDTLIMAVLPLLEVAMHSDDFLLGLSVGIGEAVMSATVGSLSLLIDGASAVFTSVANAIFGSHLRPINLYDEYLWAIGETNEAIAGKLDSPYSFYLGLELANILSFVAGGVISTFGPNAVVDKLGDAILDGVNALLGSKLFRNRDRKSVV